MNRAPRSTGAETAAIEQAAADWLARREAGLTVDEQAEFSRWLLADARHAEAARRLEATWRYLRKPLFTGQAAEAERALAARVEHLEREGRRMRFRAAAWAAGGLAAAAAFAFALGPGITSRPAAPGTAVVSVEVRPERRLLPDGSAVEFNAGAEIAVEYTGAARHVRLLRGEAHFEVVRDPARPFVVKAGDVAVRAVGTSFSVRLDLAEVDVLVTEGRVAVERADAGAAPLAMVAAGNRLSVPTDLADEPAALRAAPFSPEQMRTALAWRGRRLEFTNMPLAEAVALFNRQNRLQLELDDPGLGEVRISGIFWADDPEGFSRLMEASAGLRALPAGPDRITLTR